MHLVICCCWMQGMRMLLVEWGLKGCGMTFLLLALDLYIGTRAS